MLRLYLVSKDMGLRMLHQSGINLLELMTALVVLSVSIVIGVPTAQHVVGKNRLVGAAEEAFSNLRLLRAEAVRHNQNAYASFASSGEVWSYGMDDVAACNPSVAGDCTVDGNERRVASTNYPGVRMTTTFAAGQTGFEPRRGMALAPGLVSFQGRSGRLDVVVSALGTVRLCTASGNEAVGGYPAC